VTEGLACSLLVRAERRSDMTLFRLTGVASLNQCVEHAALRMTTPVVGQMPA